MNSLELTDKLNLLEAEYMDTISKAEKEARKLNEGESAELERIKEDINTVKGELRKLEEAAKNDKTVKKINTNSTIMEKNEFRLLSAINDIANNRQLS